MYIFNDIPKYKITDFPGEKEDLKIFEEDKWLMDTEVKYRLIYKKRVVALNHDIHCSRKPNEIHMP